MNSQEKKYISENINSKSIEDLSKELGIKKRKIKKYIESLKKERKAKPEVDSSPKKRYSAKSEILIFVAIVAVAFIVRLVYLNQIKTSPFFTPFYRGLDDYLYDSWAQNIASGDIIGKEVFYGLPLYPYFLGFIYFLFGHSVYIAKLIQLMIGAISCGLVYVIGQKVFSRVVGIIAAFIMTFYAMSIYFEGQFVSSSLAVFLNLITILILLSIKYDSVSPKWLTAGILLGLSSLASASILVFIPFIIFWSIKTFKNAPKKELVKNTLFLLLGIVLIITPVTLRNYIVAKDFVAVTAHSGVTFYAGNNPGSDGTFHMPKELGTSVVDSKENSKIIAERISGRSLKPSETSNFWFKQSMQFIKEEPAKYLKLVLKKMFLFWNVYEIPDIMPIEFFKQYSPLLRMPLFSLAIILPLSLLGLALNINNKKPEVLLLGFFLVSIFISTVIYFVNSRYRLIAVPYLAIFAAFSLCWIYNKIREKQINKVAIPVGALILISLLTHIRVLEFGMAQSHNNLGIILKRKGLYKEAVEEYNKAIKENPGYSSPYFNLGLLYMERGNQEKALMNLEKAVEINPSLTKAYNKIGEVYSARGDKGKAFFYWEKSINIDPNQPEILRQLQKKP